MFSPYIFQTYRIRELLCVMLLVLWSHGTAAAADFVTTGKVAATRIHTRAHPSAAVAGVLAFQMDVALPSACSWIWIGPDDPVTQAMVLRAQGKALTVTVRYANTPPAPWGDAYACVLTSMDS